MPLSRPTISVIVPVYNAEQYIEECVQSILKQNYIVPEIILVDDDSSDKSGSLCDSLAERYGCIKTMHRKHGGITRARLAGVKASVGQWITFVDADDWIDENAYKDLVLYKDCDVIMTGICRYIDAGQQIMQMPYLKEGFYDKKKILSEIVPVMLWNPELKTWALDPSLCTKIFKREIILDYLEKAQETGSNYGEDSMVIFPMMFKAQSIQITRKIYYFHRQRPAGVIPPYIEEEEFISRLHKVYEYLKLQFQKTGYWNIMQPQLDCFYIGGIELKKRCYDYPVLEFSAYFPIDRIPQNSEVILYGAGNIGRQYREQNFRYHFCNIISWVDTKYEKYQSNDIKIENPEIIKEMTFDYILIAVDSYYSAREIACYLKKMGVRQEQIVWHSVRADNNRFEDVFDDLKWGII